MALKSNVRLIEGVEVEDAYVKVISFSGGKDEKVEGQDDTFHIAFQLGFYGPVDDDGQRELFHSLNHRCGYDIEGDNALKQAYEHLKTLPEFSNAEDV